MSFFYFTLSEFPDSFCRDRHEFSVFSMYRYHSIHFNPLAPFSGPGSLKNDADLSFGEVQLAVST